MTDAIKPPNAVSIWASSTMLYVECPSPDGECVHQIKLPLVVHSFTVILDMLKARHAESKIGEAGDLTKHQVRRLLNEQTRLYKGPIKRPRGAPVEAPSELRSSIQDLLRKNGHI